MSDTDELPDLPSTTSSPSRLMQWAGNRWVQGTAAVLVVVVASALAHDPLSTTTQWAGNRWIQGNMAFLLAWSVYRALRTAEPTSAQSPGLLPQESYHETTWEGKPDAPPPPSKLSQWARNRWVQGIILANLAYSAYHALPVPQPKPTSPTQRYTAYLELSGNITMYNNQYQPPTELWIRRNWGTEPYYQSVSKIASNLVQVAEEEALLASSLANVVTVDISLARAETTVCTRFQKVVQAVAEAGNRVQHLAELSYWTYDNKLRANVQECRKYEKKKLNELLKHWPEHSHRSSMIVREIGEGKLRVSASLGVEKALDQAWHRCHPEQLAWFSDAIKLGGLAQKGKAFVDKGALCQGSAAKRGQWLDKATWKLQVRHGPLSTGWLGREIGYNDSSEGV